MAQSTWAQPAPESTACKECGESFAATSPRHVFCSRPCTARSSKRRQAERHASRTGRQCARCGELKLNARFPTLNASYCRPCLAAYKRERRQDPSSGVRLGDLRYRERLRERDPQYLRKYVLSKYDLTPESFADLLASQGGVCAICGTDEPKGKYGQWHIDHDQKCCPRQPGKHGCCGRCIRALLCSECNFGVGKFQDDPVRLRAAADYIELHRPKSAART